MLKRKNGDDLPSGSSARGRAGSNDLRILDWRITRLAQKDFTSVYADFVLNSCMIRRALAVAVGLFVVCFCLEAQQAKRTRGTAARPVTSKHVQPADASDTSFRLSLHQPKIFSAKDSSILFNKGPVAAWSDGGRLASERAFASMSMGSFELPPAPYLPPDAFASMPATRGSAISRPQPENLGTDGKDFDGEILSPPNRFYYGGEIGFLYGHGTGKGGGDLIDSYIFGQAGNDHFQITAGAEYEHWSGNAPRFRSFPVSR